MGYCIHYIGLFWWFSSTPRLMLAIALHSIFVKITIAIMSPETLLSTCLGYSAIVPRPHPLVWSRTLLGPYDMQCYLRINLRNLTWHTGVLVAQTWVQVGEKCMCFLEKKLCNGDYVVKEVYILFKWHFGGRYSLFAPVVGCRTIPRNLWIKSLYLASFLHLVHKLDCWNIIQLEKIYSFSTHYPEVHNVIQTLSFNNVVQAHCYV